VRLTIHRGTHEIGGSCIELSSDSTGTRLILDLGMPLVQSDGTQFEWSEHKGKNIQHLIDSGILPSIEGLYKPSKSSVSAVLLSHAHQDHYGFLQFVQSDIPIYMSPGTKSLAEVSNLFIEANINIDNVKTFKMWRPFKVSSFTITPYLMDHSAPDAAAFLIEADQKRIFYTGDFRGHGRKKILFEKLKKQPPENIDYLIMEGSMIGREEGLYPDETSVEEALVRQMRADKRICFIFTSSQNLDRIISVFRATKRSDRILVIDLYTAFVLEKLSGLSSNIPQFNWGSVRVFFLHHHAQKLAELDKQILHKYAKHRIRPEEIYVEPNNKVVLSKDNRYYRSLITKCGEVTAIYSMWHGYLERGTLPEFLAKCGLELLEIHTSGHAILQHLKDIAEAINPKFIIPIHTFYPEKFNDIFPNVIQVEDGKTISLG
jgi:ribonuclease J